MSLELFCFFSGDNGMKMCVIGKNAASLTPTMARVRTKFLQSLKEEASDWHREHQLLKGEAVRFRNK